MMQVTDEMIQRAAKKINELHEPLLGKTPWVPYKPWEYEMARAALEAAMTETGDSEWGALPILPDEYSWSWRSFDESNSALGLLRVVATDSGESLASAFVYEVDAMHDVAERLVKHAEAARKREEQQKRAAEIVRASGGRCG